MKKATKHFKETIRAELENMAEKDPLFAESLKKEDKTLNGCINYILGQVRKIGANGYTDDEIFGMAAHYYDEDDLKEADPVSCQVVVNHKPELSKEEIAGLKEKARKEIIEAEKKRMISKRQKPAADSKPKSEQLSLI